MREILFRGKRVDNGEWVVSNSIMQTNYSGTFLWYKGCWGEAESVGEYTGLTDKKGKKIYEGDILQDKFGQIKTVDYYKEWGAFRTCFVKAFNEEGNLAATVGGASFVGDIWKKYEVIGNIHDNPELLEEK